MSPGVIADVFGIQCGSKLFGFQVVGKYFNHTLIHIYNLYLAYCLS